jgi:hypothetical protein
MFISAQNICQLCFASIDEETKYLKLIDYNNNVTIQRICIMTLMSIVTIHGTAPV